VVVMVVSSLTVAYGVAPLAPALSVEQPPATEAEQLLQVGDRSFESGNYADALKQYQAALQRYRAINQRAIEGRLLFKIGETYRRKDQWADALRVFQSALPIAQTSQDRALESDIHNGIGQVYESKGEYSRAVTAFQTALAIRRELGDRLSIGRTLNNLGLVAKNFGQFPQALHYYQQALDIFQEFEPKYQIPVLNNLGLVHNALGDYVQALSIYEHVLALSRKTADRSYEGIALHNIGFTYERQTQYAQALRFYQQALIIRPETDLTGRGRTLNQMGVVYTHLKQYSQALTVLQQAEHIFQQLNAQADAARTRDNLGRVHQAMGQFQIALALHQSALSTFNEIGDRTGQRNSLSNLGAVFQNMRQSSLAIAFYKQSINVTEVIRQDLRELSRQQQESYTQTVADTYRKLADLLLQQDRVLEAQQVLDLLKVQELDDYLRNVRGGKQALYELPPEQAILKEYNELQTSAIQLGQELTDLRKLPAANRTATQQQRIAHLVKLQDDLNQQFNGFTDRSDVIALVKQLTPTVLRQTLDLTQLDALRNDLRQLNAVLIYPLVLDDRLELVITTPDAPPLRRTVNVKRQELNAAIVEFRRALQDPTRDAKVPAQKLYTWLIKPLEADLKQAKAKTIIYAPDGQLRYIPLQALHDGQQWLIQRYGINNITARSFTEFKTQPIRQPHVLAGAFAKGQYRFQVGDRPLTFNGLPFAGQEVDALVTLVPNTKKLVDQLFSRDATTTQMNEFNVVHLATHASFVPGIATDSFIVFGNGDQATLKDIESWSLNNVDLVVLSACETGLGGKFGNGEEILGLGYQFQNRGAKAAIASLWSVDDGGTAALMSAFYTALKSGTLTKAAALQQAQITMINRKLQTGGKTDPRSSVNFPTGSGQTGAIAREPSHPYYWAPFILIGNGL
jgi:CHAT domain-containing protein/Tfp pilus assembly protein PilF